MFWVASNAVEDKDKYINKIILTRNMADKSFVLMSLKEKETKKLTQVLSNETCRKILEYLSGKEHATETQISKELGIPISTTHYNLKQLKENKLVTEDEYHYSPKGKEVTHYKIANKYIIIAPTEDPSFMDKLKKFIPIYLVVGAISGIIWGIEKYFPARKTDPIAMMTTEADIAMRMVADEAAPIATATPATSLVFLASGVIVLTIVLIWEFVKDKKNKTPSE